MRKFHNKVKTNLIYDAIYLNRRNKIPVSLLDIGVGRGGDIFKWDKCNIHEVVGYDIDQQYIDECNDRFSNTNLNCRRNYKFYCCPTLEKLLQKQPIKIFDIVSCQFTIHYFFQNEQMIVTLIRNISNCLKKDGKFIGTFMDGDSILNLNLEHHNDTLHYKNTSFLLNIENSDKIYGRHMEVYIADTLYFGEKSVSKEYLVSFKNLNNICKNFNLKLVKYKPFIEYYKNHNNEQMFSMDDDHKQCSFLYSSFEFMKI